MRNTNKNKILKLYYEKHFTRIQIQEKLSLSKTYITNIIKQDLRYTDEKNYRKNNTIIKHTDETKQYIKNKRNQDSIINAQIKQQHNQAARELSSGGKSINNRVLRKWCAGAYNYNSEKNRFEFDNNIGRSYAMPKNIKLK